MERDLTEDEIMDIHEKIEEITESYGVDFSCVLLTKTNQLSLVSNLSQTASVFALGQGYAMYNKATDEILN